ncbi:MAG: hypothetical protein ACREQW_08525 [Candidatus Binatia bacterium]
MDSVADLEKKREQAQAALARKLGLLEEHVFGTIEETKNTLRRTVDLEYQVKNHPLVTVGLSALLGYLIGRHWFQDPAKFDSAPADKTDSRAFRGRNSSELWDEGLALLRRVASVAISDLVVDWVKERRPPAPPPERGRAGPKS